MPEGPEVKIITEQLAANLVGKQLKNIQLLGGRFKPPREDLRLFAKELPLDILKVNCRGKFIYFTLSQDWVWFNHLGMTGTWTWDRGKHAGLGLELFGGQILYYEDQRRFGNIVAHKDPDNKLLKEKLLTLGNDLFQNPPSYDLFFRMLLTCRQRNKTLAEFLMSQEDICGVGNYIKAEALYRAKLSPWRKPNSCTTVESMLLLDSLLAVMKESYQAQGATFQTYRNLMGPGKFASFFRVYKQSQDPQGLEIISEETPDKRTTWWCPKWQT